MTEELRTLMERVAEGAPAAIDTDDLWRSARRARRRELVLVPVVGLAALVLVVAGVVGLGHRSAQPAAPAHESGSPAIPSRIRAMPMAAAKPTHDLALGVLAAVYRAEPDVHPVAVSAMTGAYHRLALPGFDPRPTRDFALSPDGTMLAYSWHGPLPATPRAKAVPSGIAILDLLGGQVTRYRMDLGKGVRVTMPAWSPDGRFVAFDYGIATKLTRGAGSFGAWRVGVLDTRASSAAAGLDDPGDAILTMPRGGMVASTNSAVGVLNDGTVIATGFDVRVWHPERKVRTVSLPDRVDGQFAHAATSLLAAADGRHVVITLGSKPLILEVSSGQVRPMNDLAKGDYTAFGWVGGSVAGIHVTDADSYPDEAELELWPATGKAEPVGTVERDASENLSLATGLMSLAQPTASFPAPSWADSGSNWWMWAMAAGVALGVALGLAEGYFLWRRRRT